MAAEELLVEAGVAPRQSTSGRSHLPRPEPPHLYQKSNRQDYNRWERDCESYHLRNPTEFSSEARKVDFGVDYISEVCKSIWENYAEEQRRLDSQWAPTWANLKLKMLNALGSPDERRQNAYNAIKNCRQRKGQSPTELLNYLRPLWIELLTPPGLQVLEFTAALEKQIQSDLMLLPADRRNDLVLIEEQANTIYRRLGMDKKAAEQKDNGKRPYNDHEGEASPPAKKGKPLREGSKTTQKAKDKRKSDAKDIECYYCHKRGHYANECRKKAADEKDKEGSGKDQGQQE